MFIIPLNLVSRPARTIHRYRKAAAIKGLLIEQVFDVKQVPEESEIKQDTHKVCHEPLLSHILVMPTSV